MNNYMRFETKVSIIKESIKQINPEFALSDVLVCYHGDNRNRTSISKSVIENALYSIYGIPIVGEWIKEEEDQSKEKWGSHGGRIILDSTGIKFEQTTKSFGFVTKEAVENASWVEIVEKDGHTKHEYLKLSGCILWTERYEECKTILDADYGQSMEISIQSGKLRDDGYYQIDKFIFSALCILGDDYPPCFEGAMIGRHYAFDDMKNEVTQMLNAYKKYELNVQNEGVIKEVKDKIVAALRKFTFKNHLDVETEKYVLLSCRDGEVDVLDREGYKAFSIAFTQDSETDSISFDLEGAKQKPISTSDHADMEFDLNEEIQGYANAKAEFAVATAQNKVIDDLNIQLQEAKSSFSILEGKLREAEGKLAVYVQAESEAKDRAHRAEIESKLDEYKSRLNQCSEYLVYRSKVDYNKTVEQVDVDMLMILGKFSKGKPASKFTFSPTITSVVGDMRDTVDDRYGGLLDRVCPS